MNEVNHNYTDEDGNVIAIAIESHVDGCPICGSSETKCKGSFHKCFKCGKRFNTAIWAELKEIKDD